MSEIKLIFIRHGEAANAWGNHPDPGLSDKGILQAKNLEFRFGKYKRLCRRQT